MLIQCPACNSQAKLPSSKEGAKVRCGECGRVYAAHPFGARGKRKEDPTKYFLIGGAVVVFAGVMIATRGGPTSEPPPVVEAAEPHREPPVTGWNSPIVQQARLLHDWVYGMNEGRIGSALDAERIYGYHNDAAARQHGVREDEAGGETDETALAPGDGDAEPDWAARVAAGPAWAAMTPPDRILFLQEVKDDLLRGDGQELIGSWNPYDGWVVEETDDEAIIRLKVHHRDASLGLADRHVEWRFVKRRDSWKAWYWARWISPDEIKHERTRRKKKTIRRTLSDGSIVIEGVVRTIPYEEDTPQELRDEIEAAISTMIDFEVRPKENTAARQRLVEIGIPAVPGLLTRMATIPFETEEQAIQLNLIHERLQDITGYITSFDVHVAMGTTEERQASGLKQWFGWYDRKWKKFKQTGKVLEEDPLWDDLDFKPRNERERREFEELRREHERKLKEKDDRSGS